MPVVGDGASKVMVLLFITHPAQHLLVQRPDELREALPDDVADHLGGGRTPELERAPIGVDDAPFAIERVEGIPHAFQDGLGIGDRAVDRGSAGRSTFAMITSE